MGWNGWNSFTDRVDDFIVRAEVDAMVSSGMKAAGYEYVNLDDGWEGTRDASGVIVPNDKFPDMKALADYVHGRGLKLGIYSSPGPRTCARYEGSYGHEDEDARTYAAWGIDYLKYDWCSGDAVYQRTEMMKAFARMGEALRRTGRPIVYSLCQYGVDRVWRWGPRRRPALANDRRHRRRLRPYLLRSLATERAREVRGPRPLERPRHARDRQR
jgi:alpha-galactosidase